MFPFFRKPEDRINLLESTSNVPQLIACLKGSRRRTRLLAVRALGRLRDRDTIPSLIQCACQDHALVVRDEAVKSLWLIGDSAIQQIFEGINNSHVHDMLPKPSLLENLIDRLISVGSSETHASNGRLQTLLLRIDQIAGSRAITWRNLPVIGILYAISEIEKTGAEWRIEITEEIVRHVEDVTDHQEISWLNRTKPLSSLSFDYSTKSNLPQHVRFMPLIERKHIVKIIPVEIEN